jgi:hypothetical protein
MISPTLKGLNHSPDKTPREELHRNGDVMDGFA